MFAQYVCQIFTGPLKYVMVNRKRLFQLKQECCDIVGKLAFGGEVQQRFNEGKITLNCGLFFQS